MDTIIIIAVVIAVIIAVGYTWRRRDVLLFTFYIYDIM